MKKFVAVYVFGGIIECVQESTNLKELVNTMQKKLQEDGFDYESDDARIFEVEGAISQEVYSYQNEEKEAVER